MLLKRSRHGPISSLHRDLGRKLYDQAKAASRKKKSAKRAPDDASSTSSRKKLKLTHRSKDDEHDHTSPSPGTFTAASPFRAPPLARTSGKAWIPVAVSITGAEKRLGALYASKADLENARQMTLDLLAVVTQEDFWPDSLRRWRRARWPAWRERRPGRHC